MKFQTPMWMENGLHWVSLSIIITRNVVIESEKLLNGKMSRNRLSVAVWSDTEQLFNSYRRTNKVHKTMLQGSTELNEHLHSVDAFHKMTSLLILRSNDKMLIVVFIFTQFCCGQPIYRSQMKLKCFNGRNTQSLSSTVYCVHQKAFLIEQRCPFV